MARILLSSGEKLNIASDSGNVIGNAGVETVVIYDNAPFNVDGITLDQNVERADVASASSAYKFQATGNVLKVFGTDGKLVVEMPINTSGTQTVAFGDGSAVVKFETTGANAGKVTVGGVAVSATTGGAVVTGASLDVAGASTHGVALTPTFSLVAGAPSVDEGSTASFTLTTTNVADGTSVPYTLSGINADDLASGSLSGVATVTGGKATISVALKADATTEGAETLTVSINGQSATAAMTVNDTSTTPLPSVFSIAAASAAVVEGDTGASTDVVVTITRTNPAQAATVEVNFTGTADAADYTATDPAPTGSQVAFAAGETTKTLTVSVKGDTVIEANETIIVGLSNASGSNTIATPAASVTVTITNDDVAPLPTGQTFSLTTGSDTGAAFTGTTEADTFNAGEFSSGAASSKTLTAGDNLNGGAGVDTLNVSASDVAPNPDNYNGFFMSGIEVLNATSEGGQVFDLSGTTGLTTVKSSNSSGSAAFNQVSNLVDLEVVNLTGASPVTVQYQDTAVVGTTDSMNVKLSNSNVGAVTIGSVTTANAGVETVNLTAEGAASTVAALNTNLTTLNFTGTQNVAITGALNGTVTAINAATASGGLTVATNTANALNFAGGTGNDQVTFAAGTLTVSDTVTGGTGDDRIVANQADLIAAESQISGVEYIRVQDTLTGVQNADNALNIEGDNYAGATRIELAAGYNNARIDDLTSAVQRVDILAGPVTGTLQLDDAGSSATADKFTIGVGNNADTFLGTAATNVTGANVGFVSGSIETVDIISNGSAATAPVNSLTLGAGTANINTVNISGAEGLTLATTASNITAVNAGTATGNLNLTGVTYSTTAAATITTNTGNDVVTGSARGDTINVGAGNDTVNGSTGADTITLGAGTDRVVYTSLAQSNSPVTGVATTGTDTIVDFVSGTDVIDLTGLGITSYLGSFAEFSATQGALTGVNAAAFDDATDTLWVNLDGNGTLDSNDFRVKLSGVNSLAAASVATINNSGSNVTLTAPASTSTGTAFDDTINTTVANLAGSTVNGAGGTDKLVISDAITTANFSVDDGSQTTGNVQSVEEVTLAAGTTGVGSFTINGEFNKVTAGAASSITLGTAGRNVVGSTGADTISTTSALLSAATVDGGAGTDTLALTAVTAPMVLNNGTTGGVLSNFEQVSLANGTGGNAVTIFNNPTGVSVATTTGAASIVNLGNGGQSFTGLVGNQIVSSDATVNGNDTITTGAGADVISVGGGNDNIQTGTGVDVVNMNDVLGGVALTSADTVNGGGDAGDTLNITGPASAAGSDLTNVTGFTNLNILTNGTPSTYVTTDNLVAAGTLAVNMGGATAAVTFNGAAETTGSFSMQGSAFNDVLTGGAWADTFDGGLGNDTINAGAGGDIVNGSAGNDVVDLGAGDDVFLTTSGVAGNATVTGGAGSDLFALTDLAVGTNAFQTGVISLADFALGAAGDQIYLDLTDADSIVARDGFGDIVGGVPISDDIVILGTAQTTAQITSAAAAAMDGVVAVFNSSTGHGELWFDANWSDSAGRVQIASLDNMTSAAQLGGLSTINGVDFILA
ncbi:hypothetical protein J9253_13110 [Thiothrix litoralis]|uniref:Calx-beta domain-containing protein n=1 Tax=Thiothrix litoralis TaxID=2891210 RepID=A0ABX7WMK2_9GAMM|nr:hypothetical protein [Thiothrix litoralis]QTR44949.1 hypothetical protein J9253_13110 [Thiothrix litoralis]